MDIDRYGSMAGAVNWGSFTSDLGLLERVLGLNMAGLELVFGPCFGCYRI